TTRATRSRSGRMRRRRSTASCSARTIRRARRRRRSPAYMIAMPRAPMPTRLRSYLATRLTRIPGHGLLVKAAVLVALVERAWLGCFACHGPGGSGGTHNPGSEEGEVPAFGEQTQMMYVKSADELREYILDAAPRRKRADPDYQKKVEASALRMPAYRAFLTASEVEDLVAYLRATSGLIVPDAALAARGRELATELSCFSCHGPLGAG